MKRNCSIFESLGKGVREDDIFAIEGFKGTNLLIKKIKRKLAKHIQLNDSLESEPLLWRSPLHFEETKPILGILEDMCDLIYWLSKSCKVLSYSRFEDTQNFVTEDLIEIVSKIEDEILMFASISAELYTSSLSKQKSSLIFNPENLLSLREKLEIISRLSVKQFIEKQTEDVMDNKVLSSFVSFVFTLSKICKLTTSLWKHILDERVLTLLEVSRI